MDDYDVAIVGAGSAGCALAGRLAERTSLRIALLEAGPDYGPRREGRWPADLIDAHHTPESHDWDLQQSRARVIGGCSVHNEAALVRALPGDYDRWGVLGWRDADLAPIIDEVARRVPIRTSPDDELASWQRLFLESARTAGFPEAVPFTQNIRDGIRWNAAFSFLDPVRSRLSVISDVLADRLVIENHRAQALIVHGSGGERQIRAERFVLSAGVYGSPAILLRSGVALSGVGRNLHDHPGVSFEYKPARHALRAAKEDLAAGRFYEAQVVLKTAPDLHIVPYQTVEEDESVTFGILAYYLSPRSRGRVSLSSGDARQPVAIDLAMLKDKHDVDALTEAVSVVHRLTAASPLAEAIERGPRRFRSRGRHARFVRQNATAYGHAGGTCRMGPSPEDGDVVDAHGVVHGLTNVSVADASIMPQIPRANTNFTCYVIGARVADFLSS